MSALAELEKLSPCKIEYGQWYNVCFGCYDYYQSTVARPFGAIRIDNKETIDTQLAVLSHEIGHAVCDNNQCNCVQNVRLHKECNSLIELHAHLFALKWLIKNKHKKALNKLIAIIKNVSIINEDCAHRTAANELMKKRIWRKCLKLIGEK